MEVPQKIKNRTPLLSSHITCEYIPKRINISLLTIEIPAQPCLLNSIHNSQIMELT
jgi:hypothetical protein